jgi:hypothetical protein
MALPGQATETQRTKPAPRSHHLATPLLLTLILALGCGLRIWILSSPLGEVEADESVVGLMALHIQAGERPLFYWGQPYLGSLESYLAAALFAVVGPSNVALKCVPGLSFLAFVLLVYRGARRDFGPTVALLSALYLALPPSFLAIWSLKARGGYVELLTLGQALLVLAPWIARSQPGLALKVGLAGLLAGLLLWIHVLGLVYILPTALYLLVRLNRRLWLRPLLAGLAGTLLGFAPALMYNLQNGWETVTTLSGGSSSQETFQDNLAALARVGLPVLVGLGQATSSPILFAADWPTRPGSWPWVPPLLLGLVALALLPSLPAVLASSRAEHAERWATAFFGLSLLCLTPLVASLGRFGELVAEPRYALPLYSTAPLFAYALVRLRRRLPALAAALGGLVLAANLYSLATAVPRLNQPTTAGASTERTRAELLTFLEQRGLSEIYVDYWLAYPLAFESRESVIASVSSGGYNRFAPYAYLVAVSDRPGFVFVSGSPEQQVFELRLREWSGSAVAETVSIYTVYRDVVPLDSVRP